MFVPTLFSSESWAVLRFDAPSSSFVHNSPKPHVGSAGPPRSRSAYGREVSMNTLRPRLAIPIVAVAAILLFASSAGAFNQRNPQVPFCNGSLQAYLNANDGGINTATDQLDAQVWSTSVSGNATFTLMIELAGFAASNDIGVYNANNPAPLFLVFPGAASAGWYATAHFGAGGSLIVSLFDNNGNFMGNTAYGGANKNAFGFYLQGPGGTFYSQDALNGGSPQVLTYAGTGQNFGDWWECFEDLPAGSGCPDYDDAVLLIQSVSPVPVNSVTWGHVKSLYK